MKAKPVITRSRADDDVDEAFEYYFTEAGPSMAEAFIDEFKHATAQLSHHPLSGSPRLGHTLFVKGLRQWPLRKFPFVIIYVVSEYSVEIWRVLHGHTDIPASIRDDE